VGNPGASDINAGPSSGENSDPCSSPCAFSYWCPVGRAFLAQNVIAIGISLIILAIGLVGCFALFIYLCFKYPSAANIILPLLGLPAALAAFKGRKKIADVYTKLGQNKNSNP
jgi:hypothetical protein